MSLFTIPCNETDGFLIRHIYIPTKKRIYTTNPEIVILGKINKNAKGTVGCEKEVAGRDQ